jgi:hypothetical protein
LQDCVKQQTIKVSTIKAFCIVGCLYFFAYNVQGLAQNGKS